MGPSPTDGTLAEAEGSSMLGAKGGRDRAESNWVSEEAG